MANPYPPLASEPKWSSILRGRGDNTKLSFDGEEVEIRVYNGFTRRTWSSGRFSPRERRTKFYVPTGEIRGKRGSIRIYFIYTRAKFGAGATVVTVRLPTSYLNPVTGVLVIPNANYASLLGTSKTRAAMRLKVSRFSLPRSTSLRPSPEIRQRSSLNYNWTNTQGVIENHTNTVRPYYSRTWTGTRTPGFGKLKAKGLLPVNGHTANIQEINEGQVVSYTFDGNFARFKISNWARHKEIPAGPTFNTKTQNISLRRLIDQTGGLNANLAQDVAQINQTTRLIATTAARLTNSVNALKRGNITGAVNALWDSKKPRFRKGGGPAKSKSTANNWLEMQYGWKPLLMDVHGSMESLARFNLANSLVQQVRSSATLRDVYRGPTFGWDSTYTGQKSGEWEITTQSTFKYGMRYRLASPLTAFLAQTGFTNPINLAWELLPYSFVVDWFLPIGPYLETLSAWDGLQFVDGYQVQFVKQSAVCRLAFSGTPVGSGPAVQASVGGSYSRTWIILTRTKLSAFPSARFPQLKNPFSTTHALNGLALLRAAFK